MSYPARVEGLGKYDKDERTQFFRKIYLSLYSKGFERVTKGIICKRWVGDWTQLQYVGDEWGVNMLPPTHPQIIWLQRYFFPVILGCSTRGLGDQPLLGHDSPSSIFSKLPVAGLYNNSTFTYFLRASQFALNSTLRQSRLSPDILDRMHLLLTQVHFFFGRVQYGICICIYQRIL